MHTPGFVNDKPDLSMATTPRMTPMVVPLMKKMVCRLSIYYYTMLCICMVCTGGLGGGGGGALSIPISKEVELPVQEIP